MADKKPISRAEFDARATAITEKYAAELDKAHKAYMAEKRMLERNEDAEFAALYAEYVVTDEGLHHLAPTDEPLTPDDVAVRWSLMPNIDDVSEETIEALSALPPSEHYGDDESADDGKA